MVGSMVPRYCGWPVGKPDVAVVSGVDAGAGQLGEADGGLGAIAGGETIADDERGVRGGGEDLGGCFDGGPIGALTLERLGRGDDLHLALVVERVRGEANIDGAGRRRLRDRERAAHHARHLLSVGDLHAPFGELGRHLSEVEAALGELADVLVSGGDDDGRAALVEVGEQADAVREAACRCGG